MGDEGVHTTFVKDTCKMVRGAMVLMWEVQVGTLYKLPRRTKTSGSVNMDVLEIDQISSCLVNSTVMWHQWMGHISEANICSMHNKCMVEGLLDCSLEIYLCEHCGYGKKSRGKFPFGATRGKVILEVVHSDMFGPVSFPALGGSLYYNSFIDDLSRMTWLYFLKKKYEDFERFQEFKDLVGNQSDINLKVLRTNKGGELYSKEFDHFYR